MTLQFVHRKSLKSIRPDSTISLHPLIKQQATRATSRRLKCREVGRFYFGDVGQYYWRQLWRLVAAHLISDLHGSYAPEGSPGPIRVR